MWKHALVFICLFLLLCSQVHGEDTLIIKFNDIGKYVEPTGSRSRLIENQYRLVESDRRKALEWSNPELAFESQDVDGNRESEYTLSKSFEFPWSYLASRNAWNVKLSAAQQMRIADIRNLKSELRAGYVAIGLYREHSDQLNQLREIVVRVSGIASSRHREGFISGTENHLVQMLLLNLSASHQAILEEQRSVTVNWRAAMGIPPNDELRLVDQPEFQSVNLKPLTEYVSALEDQPALLAQTKTVEALGKLASAESKKVLPGFSLSAGLKRIGSDNGHVIGISLALPLLNSNRAAVNSLRAQALIAQSEADIDRNRMMLGLESLLQSISNLEKTLEPVSDVFSGGSNVMSDLVMTYEEGFITLSELLNSIQIEIAGSASYYEQLRRYYANLFELEAITGDEIVKIGN